MSGSRSSSRRRTASATPAAGAFTQTFWAEHRGPPAGSCPWQPLHGLAADFRRPRRSSIWDFATSRSSSAASSSAAASPSAWIASDSASLARATRVGSGGGARARLVLERHRGSRAPGAVDGVVREPVARRVASKSACCAFAATTVGRGCGCQGGRAHPDAGQVGTEPCEGAELRATLTLRLASHDTRSTTPPPSWVPATRRPRRRCSCPGSRSARSPASAPSPAGRPGSCGP